MVHKLCRGGACLLPKTNAYHSTNVERTNFVGDGASTSRYDGFIATSYDIRVYLRAVEGASPYKKQTHTATQTDVHAPTNAIQYGSAPLKKPRQPLFEKKGFGDGGVGEGPFSLKRSFPHEKTKKKGAD